MLLINGKDDFGVPAADQQHLFNIIGSPSSQKNHVILDGGHVPQDMRGLFRAVLNWYDTYLGPVK